MLVVNTIDQKPDTAKYDGMPRAAIQTGMVDLILSPEEIADNIGHVRFHPYLLRPLKDADDLKLTDAQLRDVYRVLRRTSGIDFAQYKTPTIKRRLFRRMAVLRLTDPDTYIRHLVDHAGEAKALAQDLLIHVTRFFRDPESFTALTRQVLEPLVQARGEEPIRIWVPGCATGEEVYSIAICLLETLGDRVTERRVQLFGTDVSDPAIDHARSGAFALNIAADVSPERLKRFFAKTEEG